MTSFLNQNTSNFAQGPFIRLTKKWFSSDKGEQSLEREAIPPFPRSEQVFLILVQTELKDLQLFRSNGFPIFNLGFLAYQNCLLYQIPEKSDEKQRMLDFLLYSTRTQCNIQDHVRKSYIFYYFLVERLTPTNFMFIGHQTEKLKGGGGGGRIPQHCKLLKSCTWLGLRFARGGRYFHLLRGFFASYF